MSKKLIHISNHIVKVIAVERFLGGRSQVPTHHSTQREGRESLRHPQAASQ